jgi:hypothetical protein
MYPHRDLTRLALHKAILRRRITRHRAECVRAATGVLQPLAWLDRLLVLWRRLSPLVRFAIVPLGLLLRRTLPPRRSLLDALLRWGPLAFALFRGAANRGRP